MSPILTAFNISVNIGRLKGASADLRRRSPLATTQLVNSVDKTRNKETRESNSAVCPAVVATTVASRLPNNRLIITSENRRHGFCNHRSNRPSKVSTKLLRRVFCTIGSSPPITAIFNCLSYRFFVVCRAERGTQQKI